MNNLVKMTWSLVMIAVMASLLIACDAPGLTAPTATPIPTTIPTSTPTSTPTRTSVPTATPQPPSPTPTLTWEGVAELVKGSVVYIEVAWPETFLFPEGYGSGTGFVIDARKGHIATVGHVPEGSTSIKIYLPGSIKSRPARVIGISMCEDLTILQVDIKDGLQDATLGDSNQTHLGEEVAAMGYSLLPGADLDPTLSIGTIGKKDVQQPPYNSLFAIQLRLSPGDSGGPLINRRGEVIGINVLTVDSENLGYAIPISYAKPILQELQNGKSQRYAGLNLYFHGNIFPEYYGTEKGVPINAVGVGSSPYKAGFRGGDLLMKVNGTEVNSVGDVCDIFSSHVDGNQLRLTVLRVDSTTNQKYTCEGDITLGVGGGAAGELDCSPARSDPGGSGGGGQSLEVGPIANCDPVAGYTLVICEDFNDNQPEVWPVGSYEYDSESVEDGQYTVHIDGATTYQVAIAPNLSEADNIADGAVIAYVRARGDGVAGVMARANEEGDFYDCWIDNAQRFGCFKWVNDKHIPITKTVQSNEIIPQGYNEIMLATLGKTLYFWINGEQVAKLDDSTLESGSWGIFASTAEGENTFTAFYDQIYIYRAK